MRLLVLILACASSAAALTVNDLAGLHYIDGSGNSLPYRLFTPAGRGAGQRFPLVLFLHGAGGRGNDNLMQIDDEPIALTFCAPDHQIDWPCFMIAPQCPVDKTWAAINAGSNWNPGGPMPVDPTWPLAAAKAVVDQLLAANADIDPAQVYVVGFSMGGYGTWEAAIRWPQTFRKLAPICGGGDPGSIGAIAGRPIWAFHAADDGIVPVQGSRAMANAVWNAGGNALYTEYPSSMNIGHYAWNPAFRDPDLLPWLFGQPRRLVNGGDGLAAEFRNNTDFSGAANATGYLSGAGAAADYNAEYSLGTPKNINADDFCVRFSGVLLPPVSGTYTINGSADDWIGIWIDGTQVVNGDGESGSIVLVAGTKVPIRIDYIKNRGLANFAANWQPPGAGSPTVIPRDNLFSGANGQPRPFPPSALTATADGTTAHLSWSDNSSNETGFLIEVSSDGISWSSAATTAANATASTVSGLSAGTRYRFRVRGINASGPSPHGSIAQVLTGSGGGLSGDLNGDGAVDFRDRDLLLSRFGRRSGDTGWDVRYDRNGDGRVDALDLAQQLGH